MARTTSPQAKKTETLTLRLDPKAKFAIEILAREQKRTLAGVVEWAISKALSGKQVITDGRGGNLLQLVEKVWSPDDFEKVVNLGVYAQHLLSYDEYCLWVLISSNPAFFEVLEKDEQDRITKFRLHRNRLAYARDLVAEALKELEENNKILPISLNQIYEASGGQLQELEKFVAEEGEAVQIRERPIIGG